MGFVIETVKGLWIVNCNSILCGEKKVFSIDKNTYNRVDFRFKMPQVANGDYVVGVAVSRGDKLNFKVLTWLYNVLYIQVSNSGDTSAILSIDTDIKIYSTLRE